MKSKNLFENPDWKCLNLHGEKMAVTHFVTQFTHVSRHLGVFSKKQKKCLGKTVHKTTFKKCAKTK